MVHFPLYNRVSRRETDVSEGLILDRMWKSLGAFFRVGRRSDCRGFGVI